MTLPSHHGHRRSAHAIVVASASGLVVLAVVGACFNFSGYSLLPSSDAGDVPDEGNASDVPDQGNASDTSGCELASAKAECTAFPACGCDDSKQCDIYGLKMICVPSGSVEKGGACIQGGCAPGLTCNSGACKRFCSESKDCPNSGDCWAPVYQQQPVPGYRICTDECDLAAPEQAGACAQGLACVPWEDVNKMPGHSFCITAGTNTSNCGADNPCGPGFVCFSDGTCHKWCHGTDGGLDCPANETCRMLQQKGGTNPGWIYVQYEGFGACDVPDGGAAPN
jgi:hypothetical protein